MMPMSRRAAILTTLALGSALSACSLISLDDLQKGQGGASSTTSSQATSTGKGSTSGATTATSSSGNSMSTGTVMPTLCSPHPSDMPCAACLRTSCCKELKDCDKSGPCEMCSDCMQKQAPTTCAATCSSGFGMTLFQCASFTCSAACN